MKSTKYDWPILIVSGQFHDNTDEGFRLNELVNELEEIQKCSVIPSFTYEDAMEVFISRSDIGAVVIDWDLPFEGIEEVMTAPELIEIIKVRNKTIPILLLTDRLDMEDIPVDVLRNIDGYLWKTADTVEFLSGRVEMHLLRYIESVYPKFFKTLVKYAKEYKYAWHTPGHMGGEGFLRGPAGVALYKFYGENTLRSDL